MAEDTGDRVLVELEAYDKSVWDLAVGAPIDVTELIRETTYVEPAAGSQLVIFPFDVTVKTGGVEATTKLANNIDTNVDLPDRVVGRTQCFLEDEIDLFLELKEGATQTGHMCFELKTDEIESANFTVSAWGFRGTPIVVERP